MLVRNDLTGCVLKDCILCESYQKGASHTRRGAQQCSGQCSLCKAKVVKAVYYGETGDSAYQRMTEHVSSIKNEDSSNAFAKHLQLYHPEE